MNVLWVGTLCLVLVAVLGDAAENDLLQEQRKELDSAIKAWKMVSTLSSGYIVRKSDQKGDKGLLGNFVDHNGRVQGVCGHVAKPTLMPTTPPSSKLVKMVTTVEKMLAMLKKVLREKLCKVVHIAYEKVLNYPDVSYPIFAKLAGCSDPRMDAIYELGQVLMVPTSRKSSTASRLCKLAKLHSKAGNSNTVKTAMAIASGFLMPGPVVPPKSLLAAQKAVNTAVPNKDQGARSGYGANKHAPIFFGIGPVIPKKSLEKLRKLATSAPEPSKAQGFSILQHAFDRVLTARKRLQDVPAEVAATVQPGLAHDAPLDPYIMDETGMGDAVMDTNHLGSESDISSEDSFNSDSGSDDDDDDNADDQVFDDGAVSAHHKRHGRHHRHRGNRGQGHSRRRVLHILFLVGACILGIALLYVLYLSCCRSRRPSAPTTVTTDKNAEDAMSYCELLEQESSEHPPRFSVVGVRLNTPIAV